MYLNRLTLKNFRNYSEQTFTFSNGINVLTGKNAQGKTNAAEAVFFLCTGYSPRASKDKLVIMRDCDSAEICANATSVYGEISVKIIFNRSDRKKIFVNGAETAKVGDLLGNIHSVYFNPAELKLVQESPEDRRRFMNISLSQMSKPYFYALQRYNKILSQRNNLLKDPDRPLIKETLPVWDEQLSKHAGIIISARNSFLQKLAPAAAEMHAFLSGGREKLTMKTESGYFGSAEEIAQKIKYDLVQTLPRDLKLGFTGIGPHRDDIRFNLNGEDARVFGSQGQQRTVALALKLAETQLFYSRFGEYPVLILDDVLSELDASRQKKLLSAVENIQTIFTATELPRGVFSGKNYSRAVIENGKIKSFKPAKTS